MIDLAELPPERKMPAAHAQLRREALERHAAASLAPRSRRVTYRLVVVAAGASVLMFGGAAAAYVALKPATVPVADQTRCYTRASLKGGDHDFYGTTVGQAVPAAGQRKAEAAVEICAALWRQGLLTAGSKEVGLPAGKSADHPVPALVACTLDNGVAAVLPGDERTCARLGLPRLQE
ncbi:hypothetical protein ACFQS1_24595 [Paractinoplanes rhizophilus]|jgi:hypothetical protein|uniref:Uncharacterized protein n=1 Tax=Paractinoplanes rhizophilus TaxID=1416877 RepID=A0ABW2HZT5_9ACTN|nr:hypothetical protein [Actinoplanes sp.]